MADRTRTLRIVITGDSAAGQRLLRELAADADNAAGAVAGAGAKIDSAMGASVDAASAKASGLAGALGAIPNPALAAAAALGTVGVGAAMFAKSAVEKYGALIDKIRELQEAQGGSFGAAAGRLGLDLTEEDAAKVDRFRAQVDALSAAFERVQTATGSALIGQVTEIVTALGNLAEMAEQAQERFGLITAAFQVFGAPVSLAARAINHFGGEVQAAAPKLGETTDATRELAEAMRAAHAAAVSGFAAITGGPTGSALEQANARLAALARRPGEIAAANAAATASAAASARRAVESASDAVVAANRRAEDAARAVADAEEDAARAIERAHDAADRSEEAAQRRLRDARNRLVDVKNAVTLEGGGADTSRLRDALLAVGDAATDLDTARETGAAGVAEAERNAVEQVENARRQQVDAAQAIADANSRVSESHYRVATAASAARQSLPPDFLDQVKRAQEDVAQATFNHALAAAEVSHSASDVSTILDAGKATINDYGEAVGLTADKLWYLNLRLDRAKTLIAQTAGFSGFDTRDPARQARLAETISAYETNPGMEFGITAGPAAAAPIVVNVQGSVVTERELAATLATIRAQGVGSFRRFG